MFFRPALVCLRCSHRSNQARSATNLPGPYSPVTCPPNSLTQQFLTSSLQGTVHFGTHLRPSQSTTIKRDHQQTSYQRMDSTFGTGDALGVGVASALTPSQVQGWAFNHDSPSGLQDAAAAAAAAGGLGLGLGGLGVGGPEQFRNVQVALEQVNRVQSLAREVMFGM